MGKVAPILKCLRLINIDEDQDKLMKFHSNSIKTARYNIITFLPLAIAYQFTNFFNIFFLFSAVLLSISVISPIDPVSAMTPFLIVMVISIIREALEDRKKTIYDKMYNTSLSLQFNKSSKTFEGVEWKNISIGRILKVMKNEVIPADLLVVKSSAENGFCYLQTTNLDGESALKPRESMIIFQDIVQIESDLVKLKGYLEVDPPDNNIYKVEGCVRLSDYEKSYFDINNILLRGGTLKNVDYVYGIVIYTGKDTKIMKNILHGSIKNSFIDAELNKIVIFVIILTMVLCLICTILGMVFRSTNYSIAYYLQYLGRLATLLSNNTVSGDSTSEIKELFKIFAAFFTIFNTLVPISVMITLEVVKGIQVVRLKKDPLMKEQPGEKLKVLSMKLHEDLGNVKYIFTDKTGTLTRNEMEFKACSIFSKLYDEEKGENERSVSEPSDNEYVTNRIKLKSAETTSNNNNNNNGNNGSTNSPIHKSIFSNKFETRPLRESLLIDAPIEVVDLGDTPFLSMKEAALEFFLNIAINHNVLTEIDSITKEKTYTGSNPDEVVLVQAAKEVGIEFIERSNKFIRVNIFDKEFTFTIIHRFEYSSVRMRSSIIVKDKYGGIKIYMKGADSIILKKIDNYSQNFLYDATKSHLEKFAKTGLRTLCYSMKIIDQEKLTRWEIGYKKIQEQAMINKSLCNEVEECIATIEEEMLLIGVSGLEDKLQEDVTEVLQDFIDAGINCWMLTGDKLDTAESIGYSCKLFNDDTEVFKIKAGMDSLETMDRVRDILDQMEIIEKELLEFKIEKRRKKKSGEKISRVGRKTEIEKPETLLLNRNLILDKLEKNEISDNDYYGLGTGNNNKDEDLGKVNKKKRSRMNSYNIGKVHPHVTDMLKFERIDSHEIPNSNIPSTSTNPTTGITKVIRRLGSYMEENSNTNKRQRPQIGQFFNEQGNAINLNQMNTQIINQNMKFIGSNLDSNSNFIALNFLRPKVESPTNSNKAKQRPSTSNPTFKKKFVSNEKHAPSILDSSNGEDSYEIDDVDVIRFMVDKNFFAENIAFNGNNKTFVNNVLEYNNGQISSGCMKIKSKNFMPTTKNTKNPFNFNTNLNLEQGHERDNAGNGDVYDYASPRPEMDNNNKEDYFKKSSTNGVYNNNNNNHDIDEIGDKHFFKNTEMEKEKPLKNNFDFNNLFEHYKSKIKNLKGKRGRNIFNLGFDDEVKDKDESMKNFGLIIEGIAISQCLQEDIAPIFWECLMKSRSVICCRCAPIQKSELVSFVKKQSGRVTLAIGDGGNDVNMIKAANVGVGIFGKEGYQAAFNSDYAISQFKYLRRLLFVHGRYSLVRNAYFVLYFFYKNLIYTFPQFWYAFFSGFSGALYWDDWYYLGYNSFFTTIPSCVRMIYEQDIDITFEDYPDKETIDDLIPDIYKEHRNSQPFNIPKFFFVFLGGVVHSLLIYYIPLIIFKFGIMDDSGRNVTLWNQSLLSFMSLIIIQYYIIFEDSFFYDSMAVFAHSCQIIIYALFLYLYELKNYDQLSGTAFDILSNLHFWMSLLLTVYVSIIPYLIVRRVEALFSDSIINNLRYRKHAHDFAKKTYMRKLSAMQKYTRSLAKFKKIYNLNTDYEPDNLADKKIKGMVDNYKSTKVKNINLKNINQIQIKDIKGVKGVINNNEGKTNSLLNINFINNNIISNSSPTLLAGARFEINKVTNCNIETEIENRNQGDVLGHSITHTIKDDSLLIDKENFYNQINLANIQAAKMYEDFDNVIVENSKSCLEYTNTNFRNNDNQNEVASTTNAKKQTMVHDYPLEISNMFEEDESKIHKTPSRNVRGREDNYGRLISNKKK